MTSAPSSTASSAKTALHDFASACSMPISPCASWQVTGLPPMSTEPVQSHFRLYRSGMFSIAAAIVTVLNTDPDVTAVDRNRFRYTPSQRSSPSSIAGGSSGSNDGFDIMQSTSPVL